MGLSYNVDLSPSYLAQSAFRFIQLVLALTVCGLYGANINNHDQWQSKWIFAEVVAGLSALTAILYLVPLVSRIPMVFIWDTILFLLWIAVFGVFAQMYLKVDARGDGGVQRMKNAVWVDVANLICWFISALGMGIFWFFKKRRSTFTGRAIV